MLHTLSTDQLRKIVAAIGDGSDWPKFTHDPKVNYAVDCIVQDDGDVPTYDENLYLEEIQASKNAGLESGEIKGLPDLLGQRVTLFCVNYFYTGVLAGMSDDCVLLTDPSVIYQTGGFSTETWENAEKLPNDFYVMKRAVEGFGIVK